MAEKEGDSTARNMGRITLNPIPHIDLFGTIIMPIILSIYNLPLFGWAKPVPVNPYNMRNPQTGMLKVSLAGVISNLLIAIIFGMIIRCAMLFDYNLPIVRALLVISAKTVFLNLILCFFNLLPIPPLDGFGVLSFFLSPEMQEKMQAIRPYGTFILIIFLYSGGFSILIPIIGIIFRLLTGIYF